MDQWGRGWRAGAGVCGFPRPSSLPRYDQSPLLQLLEIIHHPHPPSSAQKLLLFYEEDVKTILYAAFCTTELHFKTVDFGHVIE